MSYEDLFSKAKRIAEEEGLFKDDSESHEILPNPAKLNAQKEKLTRVAARLGQETGVDLLNIVEHTNHAGSIKPSTMGIVDSMANKAESTSQTIPNQDNRQAVQSSQSDEVDPESIIQEQLDMLESWVADNISSARKDSIRFWALKIPAIFCSVSVSAVEAFGYGKLVILLGLVTAFCVGIDALFPGGQLHNAHKRAANEGRRLQNDAVTKWRQAQLDTKNSRNRAAHSILSFIQQERTRIDKYLTDAEASLGVEKDKTG